MFIFFEWFSLAQSFFLSFSFLWCSIFLCSHLHRILHCVFCTVIKWFSWNGVSMFREKQQNISFRGAMNFLLTLVINGFFFFMYCVLVNIRRNSGRVSMFRCLCCLPHAHSSLRRNFSIDFINLKAIAFLKLCEAPSTH